MVKILLVDDEPQLLDFLDEIFADAGYQTATATDGVTGLREFFTFHPDIGIIDLLIPHMDGFELCRRIREISHIPLIVLTGLSIWRSMNWRSSSVSWARYTFFLPPSPRNLVTL